MDSTFIEWLTSEKRIPNLRKEQIPQGGKNKRASIMTEALLFLGTTVITLA